MQFSVQYMTTQICGLTLSCLLVYVFCTYFFNLWKFRRFQGPMVLPLVGNMYTTEVVAYLRYLSKLRKKYGRVFTLFVFSKPFLFVCDPLIVRRVLSDSKTFYKGKSYTEKFDLVFGQGLVTSNDQKHKKDRAIFGKYFIRSSILQFVPKINQLAEEAIDSLLVSKFDAHEAVSFNIENFFAVLALRVFMNFSLSTDFSQDPEKERMFCRNVSENSSNMGQIIVYSLPIWNCIPQVQKVRELRQSVMEDFRQILDQRRLQMSHYDDHSNNESKSSHGVDDCLTAMLRENMPEKDMFDHFMTLLCAGHDTTSYYASYLCLLLAQNPEVQDKLVVEIEEYFHGRTYIEADDLSQLSYLNKVMKETLRFYAIIPIVSRTSTEEVRIKEANVVIPKDTEVMIPMSIINRDPEVWKNPTVFNPERFDDKNGDFTAAKFGLFPFSYGTRTCIGNTLSQIEVGVFICKMLQKFRIIPEPGFKVSIQSGISLTTSNGIHIRLQLR